MGGGGGGADIRIWETLHLQDIYSSNLTSWLFGRHTPPRGEVRSAGSINNCNVASLGMSKLIYIQSTLEVGMAE